MKINVEFGSVEEMQEFAKLIGGSCKCSDKTVTVTPAVEKEVEKDNSKSNKKNSSKKSEKVKSEDNPKEEPKEEKDEAPKIEAEQDGKPATEESSKDSEVTEEKPKITKEQLRAACTKAVKSGKAAEVKKIFEKYGAEKLPEVKEENFADVLKDVEAL